MARRSAPPWFWWPPRGQGPIASRLWLRVCAGSTVFLRNSLPRSPLPHSSVPGSSLVGFLKQELVSGRDLVPFPNQASPPLPAPSFPIATYISDVHSNLKRLQKCFRKRSDFLSSSLFWLQLRTSVWASRKRNKQALVIAQALGSLSSELLSLLLAMASDRPGASFLT